MSDGYNNEADGPDASALLPKFKRWFRKDREHWADWRKEAREDFAFVAGEQYSHEEREFLKANLRPIISFNRIHPVIHAVSGSEISNRQEVRYIPREMGDVKVNEVFTSAAQWFRDQCDAEDEESEAFMDAAICGLGWTETRLDYDDDPDGESVIEHIDPMEMLADCNARRKNLADKRRVWRVRRIPLDEARSMFPGKMDHELHADWADNYDKDAEEPHDQEEADLYLDDNDGDQKREGDQLVTMVQVQWWERKPVWRIADPMTGEETRLSEGEHKRLSKRMEAVGMPLVGVKQTMKVYRQAFIGKDILEMGDAPCGDHFNFQAITGYRDRNKGTWYGLVRQMKDPQRWANKWLSQALHIMNASAKGGILAEEGVAADEREFENSWTRTDAITYVKQGVLSSANGPKIQDKPQTPFPAGFYQLMEFAVSSVRDVTGVNMEILGMREADQPASLEYQRRQAGMTILSTLFDSLKRYRKRQGRVMLYYIQNDLSDNRLIRIVGEEGAKYVPLVKQAETKFDVIVDDAPTSPNQKEMVWSFVGPVIFKLPPPLQLALLDYAPLPESVIEKVKQAVAESSQPSEQQEMMTQLEQAEKQSVIAKNNAQAMENMADAQLAGVDAQTSQTKALADLVQALTPDPQPMMPRGNNVEHR